jgi:hypothetical protein
MYQAYPGGSQSPEPSSANAPQSVLRAVKVMYAGLAASLIGIAINLSTLSSAKTDIIQHNPGYTTAQINSAMHLLIGESIASGLIGAALWLWMAQSCRAGKGWARIVSTVFFAIETISVLTAATVTASGGVGRIYGFVVWAIGLIAVILLWQRSSSAYFRAPRY